MRIVPPLLARANVFEGLTNLLIPRGQFLDSVLGQAALLGKSTAWTNASAKPPLLGSGENSSINFGSSNPLFDLACYWQNRAVANTTGNQAPLCTGETGTPFGANQPEAISIAAATSASGANVGGVPSNPQLENATDAGPALQTVITLNLTGQTELDLLIAALVDNTTGGTNGTFLSVGPEVGLLGISSVVVNALANTTGGSGGLFGIPWGQLPPPPPPSLWDLTANTFGGAIFWFVQGAEDIIGLLPFGIGSSIDRWINDHLPQWLKNDG